MNEEEPLKELPGISKETYVKICDFTKEEAIALCEDVDKLQKRVDAISKDEKKALSAKARLEFQNVEYTEVLQEIDGLIKKYGSGRPGVVPLHMLKAIVGLNVAMVKAMLASENANESSM